MERRLYDNSQFSTQYHGWTSTASSNLLHLLCISSDRSDRREPTAAQQKVLPIILASEYPICTLLLYFSSLGFCFYLFGQSVLGALRFSSARDPRRLAMRWKEYMGQSRSGGILGYTLRLASLIFNQNARSLTYTKLLPCYRPRARNSFQSNIPSHFIRRLITTPSPALPNRTIISFSLPSQ